MLEMLVLIYLVLINFNLLYDYNKLNLGNKNQVLITVEGIITELIILGIIDCLYIILNLFISWKKSCFVLYFIKQNPAIESKTFPNIPEKIQ